MKKVSSIMSSTQLLSKGYQKDKELNFSLLTEWWFLRGRGAETFI